MATPQTLKPGAVYRFPTGAEYAFAKIWGDNLCLFAGPSQLDAQSKPIKWDSEKGLATVSPTLISAIEPTGQVVEIEKRKRYGSAAKAERKT